MTRAAQPWTIEVSFFLLLLLLLLLVFRLVLDEGGRVRGLVRGVVLAEEGAEGILLDRKGLLYLDRFFCVRRAHTELCDFGGYLCVFVLGTLIYVTGPNLTVIGYDSMWNKN
jgi:hypothetical protein